MTIRLTEPDGSTTDYTINALDDITVKDWHAMQIPDLLEENGDATLGLITAWTGIPKDKVERMPIGSVDQLADLLSAELQQAARAKTDEWTPPPAIEIMGRKWKVPQNIEADTIYAQWIDINSRLDRNSEEASVMPIILAILLVPEGEEYDGTKLDERIALFQDAPCRLAMQLTAFFFASGNRLQDAMSRYTNRILSSVALSHQQALTALSAGTDGAQASSDLPN